MQASAPRVAQPAEGQQSEFKRRRRAEETIEARLHAALMQGLAQIRAAVTDALESGATRTTALEEHVRQSADEVAELLRGQRGELAALSDALAETRTELHRRIDAAEGPEAKPEVEPRIEEALAGLATSVQAHRAELHATVSAGFAEAVAQVTALEQQLHDRAAALTEVVQELAEAGQRVEVRLEKLEQETGRADARIDALASSAEAGAGRLQAAEQGFQDALDRLTGLVRTRLEEALTPTPAWNPVTGSLLGDIERELDAAQGRLAQVFSSGRPPS